MNSVKSAKTNRRVEKMKFSERVKDKSFWKQVREDERYKFFIDELKEMYEQY